MSSSPALPHPPPGDCADASVRPTARRRVRLQPRRPQPTGFTLVEIMVALTLLTTIMLGLLSAFVHSRRVTEDSVMHAAATSLVYGLVEQMKGLDYTTLLPSTAVDAEAPAGSTPPYIRVRINQDDIAWLQCIYTPAGTAPQAPVTTPPATATAASLGAVDNVIGPLPLSSFATASSQRLTLNLWVWVDEMPDAAADVVEVKRITVVYTYQINDGATIRTIRDREVFIRTRFDL